MIPFHSSKRSQFVQLITDFHSENQRRVASLDYLGVTVLALVLGMGLEVARVLLAH